MEGAVWPSYGQSNWYRGARVKLLVTITSYPPALGGAQALAHQLARQLVNRHAVQVVTQWDEYRTDWLLGSTLHAPREARVYFHEGIPVQRITLDHRQRRRLAPWVYGYHVAQGPALRRIAGELALSLAPFAATADLIHNTRVGREGLSYASLQVARQRDIPFVFTPVHHPRWGTWLHRAYHRLYREADAIIALTEAERRMLVGLGVPEQRIAVTGMGPVLAAHADGAGFRARYDLGGNPVVLYLGQKYAYKGVGALLAAAPLVWRCHATARFVFVGPRTRYSRKVFANLADPRVIELDAVSLQEKTDALAACDLLCVPSTQESFGGVYTEAWSLRKPIVAADIPALREVVASGTDGLLSPVEAAALAERINYLLDQPDQAAAMGRRGCEKVATRYSWHCLADQTEHVYQRVLQGRSVA